MTVEPTGRIGIDVGATYLKAVRLDAAGEVAHSFYQRHKGELPRVMAAALNELKVRPGDAVGLTGCGAARFARMFGVPNLDLTRCQIEVLTHELPGIAYVIDIGGGSATLVQLDRHGHFLNYATNSMCAAGTGSFLDEQAGRLGISYEELAGVETVADPPTIATRCSVFAKSDLIHRQQEGFSKVAMWSGLCRGMTRTLLGTLLHGSPLDGPTAIIGGVAQNAEVLRWLRAVYPDLIQVPARPHLVAAVGAAQLGTVVHKQLHIDPALLHHEADEIEFYPWPLSLEKSIYPSFEIAEGYTDDDGNEVRVTKWPAGPVVKGYVGIDIGSTSTKAALVSPEGELIADIYRKTSGDPIGATKKLLRALRQLAERKDVRFEFLGVGTTGSGRRIVGEVIGADAVVNEISAHVAGAVNYDPTVDTIFEIGGQDSKYMHIVDGHIRDANMNYVCAAGTGSFVEEQANKLGYHVAKVGQAVLGTKPPRATDRCTVFMEQDVANLIQNGATREQALAAVMVAVCKNYLNKVLGNRHRSRTKIFFQGATARNPALVAAFERLLDVQVVVSPYCHVMGAFGVALLVRSAMAEQGKTVSAFRGLDIENRKVSLRKETCSLCQNDCGITFAEIEGVEGSPSWGYMCGRDPAEQKVRANPNARYLTLRQRWWKQAGAGIDLPENAPLVGIPQALITYSYYPLFRRFFNALGFRVQLSGETTDEIREMGTRLAGAEFCFPAKIGLGHVAYLALKGGVDFIFAPQVKNTPGNEHTTGSSICPYVQGTSAYARTALELNGIETSRLLAPFIDMHMTEKQIVTTLTEGLAKPLGRSKRQLRAAWREAIQTQREFEERCFAEGDKVLTEAHEKGERLIVLIGRPYNNYDDGVNLGLPSKLAEQGRRVLPMDFLRPQLRFLEGRYRNVFWSYGQKIVAALEQVSRDELLDAVYLTNFGCGPDSFILSYAEEIMGNRPFLALELDEHGSDTGYVTRLEAFMDVLKRPRSAARPRAPWKAEPTSVKDRTIWIPPMHVFGTRLFAAAFRRHGFDGHDLPQADAEAFEIGRALTRGSECLPTALTIGTLVKTLRKMPAGGKHAFFMPTAEGPCRFGQYVVLHRQILDREGFGDVAILSAASNNGYQGLDEMLRRSMFKAIVLSDILLKARCKVRPYEVVAGETDAVMEEVLSRTVHAIESGGDMVEAVRDGVRRISAIATRGPRKPLVGIVGEIYVRNDPYANEDLIGAVERFGGEAWMTPISEWLLYTSSLFNYNHEYPADLISWPKIVTIITNRWQAHWEHKLYDAAGEFLVDRREPSLMEVISEGAQHMAYNVGGEAQLTIGRAKKFAKQGAAMVVNCAPFGCMPGTVTSAMFRKIAGDMGIPVVDLYYDGNGSQNRRLEVFLNNAVRKGETGLRPADGRAWEEWMEKQPPASELISPRRLKPRRPLDGKDAPVVRPDSSEPN